MARRTEKSLRTRQEPHAAGDGDGVERQDAHGAGQHAGAGQQRGGRRFASRRASSAERLRRHGGCAALSSRDGESHRGARWRLRLGGKEQPARFLLRDAKAAISAAERKKAKQATTSDTGHGRKETRTAIVALVRDMAEEIDFPGIKAVARISSKRGRDKTVERYLLLTQYYTPARTAARCPRTIGASKTSCT